MPWKTHHGMLTSVAALAIIVSGGPTKTLDFSLGTFPSDVTASRTTLATETDSTGKTTWCPNNLLLASQTFNNTTYWTTNDATVTADNVTAPDGTVTADTLTATSTISSVSTLPGTNRVGVESGQAYIASAYFKAGTAPCGYIQINSRTAGDVLVNAGVVYVDATSGTTTGTVENLVGSLSATNVTVSSAAGGFYRLSLRLVPAATVAGLDVFFGHSDAQGSRSVTIGRTAAVWAGQVERVTYQTAPRAYNATTSSAYYGPRLDYDPSTLAAKGLLIESAATNLALQSSDLANAAWSTFANGSGSVGRTANSGVAPDGTTTATKIDLSRAASSEYAEIFQSITLSGVNTASFYFKAFAVGDIGKQIAVAGFTSSDIGTVNVTLTSSWQRVPVTFSSVAASTSVQVIFGYVPISTFSTATTQTGAVSFYVSAVQVEAGTFATSYIPTTSAAVARAADDVSVTGTNFSSWYNATEGAFIWEGDLAKLGTDASFFYMSDGSSANRMLLYAAGGSTRIDCVVDDNTNRVFNGSGSSVAVNTAFKAGFCYKANDFAVSVSGGTPSVDTSGTIPTVNQLALSPPCHVKKISYYTPRKSNTDLQALTA